MFCLSDIDCGHPNASFGSPVWGHLMDSNISNTLLGGVAEVKCVEGMATDPGTPSSTNTTVFCDGDGNWTSENPCDCKLSV